MLVKMSDQSGWSASRFEDILKISKGNASSRYLHPMKNEKIITAKGTRTTQSIRMKYHTI